MIYFSVYQIYNNCYSLARVWAACGLPEIEYSARYTLFVTMSKNSLYVVYFLAFSIETWQKYQDNDSAL